MDSSTDLVLESREHRLRKKTLTFCSTSVAHPGSEETLLFVGTAAEDTLMLAAEPRNATH